MEAVLIALAWLLGGTIVALAVGAMVKARDRNG